MTNTTGNPLGVGPGTALPWRTGPGHVVLSTRVLPAGGRITEWVAECHGGDVLAQKDAAYIVHTANSFPSLYEALDFMFDNFGGHLSDEDYSRIDQALSLARGEVK